MPLSAKQQQDLIDQDRSAVKSEAEEQHSGDRSDHVMNFTNTYIKTFLIKHKKKNHVFLFTSSSVSLSINISIYNDKTKCVDGYVLMFLAVGVFPFHVNFLFCVCLRKS